jgi:hypothetical protein
MGHRQRGDAALLQPGQAGNARAVLADARVVENGQAHAGPQRKTGGTESAVRAAHHDAALAAAHGLGDAVHQHKPAAQNEEAA